MPPSRLSIGQTTKQTSFGGDNEKRVVKPTTTQQQTTSTTLNAEKSVLRKTIDQGNVWVNGISAGVKVYSAINKLSGLDLPFGESVSTGGELITRGSLFGQGVIGLADASTQKKNAPGSIGQILEILFSAIVPTDDKWLIRGISQCLLNISSPIAKAREILQQKLGKEMPESYFADYSKLKIGDAIIKSSTVPFKYYLNNIKEICKDPKLIFKNLTYALSGTSTFMGLGGLLGLTPFKKLASIIRFIGAVPTDFFYAFMGHHVEEKYATDDKVGAKSAKLRLAGALWLIPGFADPIKRFLSDNIKDGLTDLGDAFDRCAAAFYQASLNDGKKKKPVST